MSSEEPSTFPSTGQIISLKQYVPPFLFLLSLKNASLITICLTLTLMFLTQAQLSLDADNLRDVEQGMKLCSQLDIPEKFAFNSTCLAELVASDGYIRPFIQMV